MKYFNKVYVVHYCPNCEEDYIVYISYSRTNCKIFINKHRNYYKSYQLEIKVYYVNHWYRI